MQKCHLVLIKLIPLQFYEQLQTSQQFSLISRGVSFTRVLFPGSFGCKLHIPIYKVFIVWLRSSKLWRVLHYVSLFSVGLTLLRLMTEKNILFIVFHNFVFEKSFFKLTYSMLYWGFKYFFHLVTLPYVNKVSLFHRVITFTLMYLKLWQHKWRLQQIQHIFNCNKLSQEYN